MLSKVSTPALSPTESEVYYRLKWLIFYRLIFTTLLMGSSVVLQVRQSASFVELPLLIIYGIIVGIFLLSFVYTQILNRIKRQKAFAFIQISLDTFVVSLIIFVTGNFSSIFSFLYLLVIIYASIFFFRRGSIVVAALCSIQYGIMVDLEYFGILMPLGMAEGLTASAHGAGQVFYKIIITMAACFMVALLSSLLSEQERKTKKELAAMSAHVKRVERLAVMGETVAGIAHEIKNPLGSLSGAIQLLKADIKTRPEHQRLMRIISRETDRLTVLINDLLVFSRPPSGRKESMELKSALQEMVGLFEKDASAAAKFSIQTDLIADVWVEMDPSHLHQILWNLLLNAVEAIDKSGRIEISTKFVKPKQVEIRISDTGCGIPDHLMPSIFNPFFTTKPRGTGLGLSIVHNLLESYESRLDVENRDAGGTCCRFKLNRIRPPCKSRAIA